MNGYARPVGTAQRPGSGVGGRPGSRANQRPALPTSMGRGQPLPGTGRLGTRGGVPGGGTGALASVVHVSDRPVTRQGLSGIKTAAQGPQRQVQDRSFWMGKLRSKINELTTEIASLNKEIHQLTQEQSSYLTYEKRAETLAGEMKEAQGQLADYNMLVDRLNTNSGFDDLTESYEMLKERNENEEKQIGELFSLKQEKENEIRSLESEIQQERQMTESLVADMQPSARSKYVQLKNMSTTLHTEMEKKHQMLETLNEKIKRLEEDISQSPVKEEAVSLHEKISELEEKRDSLVKEQEMSKKSTPQEERDRLLQQVKDDNQEVARIEHRLTEVKEKTESAQAEIEQYEIVNDEHQGEQAEKYKELKKREETMQEFMDNFEDLQAKEMENLKQAQQTVVSLLERISRATVTSKHLPSSNEYQQMKSDLEFKESEMQRSKETSEGLNSEHARLRMDLEKVDQLEEKITSELRTLKTSIATMKEELEKYNDMDTLKRDAQKRKESLVEEKSTLLGRKDTRKEDIKNLSAAVEKLKAELQENETHVQLGNLERKWQHLEQNNYSLKEYINQRTAESDYHRLKSDVMQSAQSVNDAIIKRLSKPKSMSGR